MCIPTMLPLPFQILFFLNYKLNFPRASYFVNWFFPVGNINSSKSRPVLLHSSSFSSPNLQVWNHGVFTFESSNPMSQILRNFSCPNYTFGIPSLNLQFFLVQTASLDFQSSTFQFFQIQVEFFESQLLIFLEPEHSIFCVRIEFFVTIFILLKCKVLMNLKEKFKISSYKRADNIRIHSATLGIFVFVAFKWKYLGGQNIHTYRFTKCEKILGKPLVFKPEKITSQVLGRLDFEMHSLGIFEFWIFFLNKAF